ncbi:Zinc finger protein MAGPIE [Triticum urartu]|uniref:Zinc finger protein MAGPIE n=1 Tax=Triticum urartu TaxID=4572 RepID=M7ZS10_TRIUA|nr:Zinc finger protein MAGPIE [Triticum urartu]
MAAASSAPFFGLSDAQMQPLMPAQQPPAPAAAPAPKKKRNQPGNPSDRAVAAVPDGHEPVRVRGVRQGVPAGAEPAAAPSRPQPAVEAEAEEPQGDAAAGVPVPGADVRCPEPTCVHHDPARALGDLTGIKKHYCRKHGEKKWKCDKCAKRYAVQSDWKAHSKTCGTREYRCDCGTLFSRRDSFITHRAFCDALAQESARLPPIGAGMYGGPGNMALGNLSGMAPQMPSGFPDQSGHHSSASAIDVLNLGGGSGNAGQFEHLMPSSSGSSMFRSQAANSSPFYMGGGAAQDFAEDDVHRSHGNQGSVLQGKSPAAFHGLMQLPDQHQGSGGGNGNNNLLNLGFFSGNGNGSGQDSRLSIQFNIYVSTGFIFHVGFFSGWRCFQSLKDDWANQQASTDCRVGIKLADAGCAEEHVLNLKGLIKGHRVLNRNSARPFDNDFILKKDAVGRIGFSGYQKCMTTLQMLAYGTTTDSWGEYLRMSRSTCKDAMVRSATAMVLVFGPQYLREPNGTDTDRRLTISEAREWQDNGHEYNMGYYLVDGIYPSWATFVNTSSNPVGQTKAHFVQRQEVARKDVERAFGVLQARFAVAHEAAKQWDAKTL